MPTLQEGPHPMVDEFLKQHPDFEEEKVELTKYVALVGQVIVKNRGDKTREAASELGKKAKELAIAIIQRHSNGHGVQHKAPLVAFMSTVWEVKYKEWGGPQ